jgi:hypothetical protein
VLLVHADSYHSVTGLFEGTAILDTSGRQIHIIAKPVAPQNGLAQHNRVLTRLIGNILQQQHGCAHRDVQQVRFKRVGADRFKVLSRPHQMETLLFL